MQFSHTVNKFIKADTNMNMKLANQEFKRVIRKITNANRCKRIESEKKPGIG